MNRYLVQIAACCIWLVMFGVSCATTQEKAETAVQPEAAKENVSKTEEAKVREANAKAAVPQRQSQEKAIDEAVPPKIPNVSVNVVQYNGDGIQTERDRGATEKEMSIANEPEETVAAPAGQIARPHRVPSSFKVIQYMPDSSKSLGTESLLSEISKEIAGKVFYELQEEGEKNFTAKVAVVNAVPLADFKRETEFGRIMAEYILTDLADRGLRVTELRMGQEINIVPQTGEFIMTRNIGEIANNSPELDFVVISTFTNTRKTLIVQGRLVSLKDGLVKTTWRYGMPLNRELLGLFHEVEKPVTIAVKGMYK